MSFVALVKLATIVSLIASFVTPNRYSCWSVRIKSWVDTLDSAGNPSVRGGKALTRPHPGKRIARSRRAFPFIIGVISPPNALVQLQAQYHHCGVAASEKCLSAATFVRRQRRGEVVLHFQNCHHPLRAVNSSSRRIISSLAAQCSTNDWRSDAASRNSSVSKS